VLDGNHASTYKAPTLGKDSMAIQTPAVKMVPVEADLFESVGYVAGARQLYIKFHRSPTLCFNNVPGFRYEGLLNAPRKDAYYNTFIKNFFLSKTVELPPQI
jgi:hypothetical protein